MPHLLLSGRRLTAVMLLALGVTGCPEASPEKPKPEGQDGGDAPEARRAELLRRWGHGKAPSLVSGTLEGAAEAEHDKARTKALLDYGRALRDMSLEQLPLRCGV